MPGIGCGASLGIPSSQATSNVSGSVAPVFAPCAFPGRACPCSGHPARGSLFRPGAGSRVCHAAGGRTVCLLDPDHVPAASRCPRGPRAARPAPSSASRTPPVDGPCAQPGVDMGHHAVARTPKMGDVSPSTWCWICSRATWWPGWSPPGRAPRWPSG